MSNNPHSDRLAEQGIKPHDENEPLYKYTSIEAFKAILENNTLRYSNPSIFNDPFEFTDDSFNFDVDDETFRKLLKFNISQAPPEERKKLEEANVVNSFSKDTFINVHKKRIEATKVNALVFCSSLSPLIPLMWAHYSLKHTGVCFGIKIPFDFRNEIEMVLTKSVKYNSTIQPQSILTEVGEEIMSAVYNWVYTKSNVWEYEKEMRTYRYRFIDTIYDKDFIIPKGKDYEDLPFKKDSLVEIYYGLNIAQKDIDDIEQLIKENEYLNIVSRYRIMKTKGTYNLERKQL